MSRQRDIGTAAESAVVRYLRTHGWPSAERRALHGAHDQGDITGTPAVCWEVKGGAKAEGASDGLIADWLEETERERAAAHADIGVLVTKRAACGPSRVASWWAHLPLSALTALLGGDWRLTAPVEPHAPARIHLSTAVALLRRAGYGDPPEREDE